MKKVLSVVASIMLCMTMTGCNSYQAAERVYGIIDGLVQVAQADLPSLIAAGVYDQNSGAVAGNYFTLVGSLNDQYKACIDNVQNTMLKTNAKFLGCLNIFATGLDDPKELAELRILNPNAQRKIQLYVTAFQVALNAGIVAFGGMAPAAPSVSSVQPTHAELHELSNRVNGGY